MKGFLPEPGAPSLRMVGLVSEKSAISLLHQEIRTICQNYQDRKTAESDVELWLYNAETAIRKYQDEFAPEAIDQAKDGDVTKMESITPVLTDLLTEKRQDELIGEDELSRLS